MASVSIDDLRRVSCFTFADAILRHSFGRLVGLAIANTIVVSAPAFVMAFHDANFDRGIISILVKAVRDDLIRISDPEGFSGSYKAQIAVLLASVVGTVLCGFLTIVKSLRARMQRGKDPGGKLQRLRTMAGLVGAQTMLLVVAAALAVNLNRLPIAGGWSLLGLGAYLVFGIRLLSCRSVPTSLADALAVPPPEDATREAKTVTEGILNADVDKDDTCVVVKVQGVYWRARLTPSYACFVSRTYPASLFVKRHEVKLQALGKDAFEWSKKSVRVDIALENGPRWAAIEGGGTITQKFLERLERWKSEAAST